MPWLSISLTLTCLCAQQPGKGIETFDESTVFSREEIISAKTWELTGDLGVKTVNLSGQTVVVPAKSVLLLDTGTARLPGLRPRVLLRNGESIIAEPRAGGHGRQWSFTSPLWESFTLDESQIARYQAAAVPPAGDHPAAPFVVLRNGDVVASGVDEIADGQLTVSTEFGQTKISLETVSVVVLTADSPTIDAREKNQFLIELADGQRLYCDRIGEWGEDLVLERNGLQCRVSREAIMRAVWPDAALATLSQAPSQGDGRAYFGAPALPRKDRNALGGPLRIGDRWFEHGLGMRPRSRCMFQLSDTWMYLTGHVGLDPSLGRRGDCQVAVHVGGKEACREALRGGQHGRRLLLPLGEARDIELQVDFGPGGDLGDYVNWCDLMLVGLRGEIGK
ncbi:MAG: NPCBM/NEW2 domain-containing protein [Phycisphaerae bacterium]|nr:NPCBM/NEW2 domain-containing protein [Phycisphaerae bacterium]